MLFASFYKLFALHLGQKFGQSLSFPKIVRIFDEKSFLEKWLFNFAFSR